jgi:hypothetical protein
MSCPKNSSDLEVPLAQYRIGRYLCEDVMRGKSCPHHEEEAKRLYEIVLRAQEQERQAAIDKAVEAQ